MLNNFIFCRSHCCAHLSHFITNGLPSFFSPKKSIEPFGLIGIYPLRPKVLCSSSCINKGFTALYWGCNSSWCFHYSLGWSYWLFNFLGNVRSLQYNRTLALTIVRYLNLLSFFYNLPSLRLCVYSTTDALFLFLWMILNS